MKNYYEAYNERYKTIHEKGYSWASVESTPIVAETINKYGIGKDIPMLEIGCGEGRDALPLLKSGFCLNATDVSEEAINFCIKNNPEYADHFGVMDCLGGECSDCYGFIYSVAVIHMLLPDEDRNGFYRFVKNHLTDDGIALICTMGDGKSETMTDINDAFTLQERNHPSGKVKVAGTTFRMVSFERFEKELDKNDLEIIEIGMTAAPPEFNELMYAVVKAKK